MLFRSMDDFGGADAAAGPAEEPLGRARKESVEGGKALNESVILESAGRKLIETEGLDSLIGWVLSEAAAGMPEEHFRSFATSIAQKAAKDPAKLAGWIGKKKHGMAAMAQLAEPTYTATGDVEIVEGKTFRKGDDDYSEKKEKDSARKDARRSKEEKVDEGKTYRRGDDADEDEDKKDRDVARKDARKRKNDEKVDEGKTYRRGEDADEDESKKDRDVARKDARKRKGDEKIDEAALAAKAIAQLIEASIAREGKGNAAKAVKEAVAYLAGQNLVEGEIDLESAVLEAFSAQYGVKPAAYSVIKVREVMQLSTQDKKNGNSALAKMSGQMGANKTAGTKSVQSAMQGMDSTERNAATKMLNKMKQDGKNPKNAGEFAANASSMVGDDDDQVNENINAAHWPTDTHGQYKGEPMSTDYGKLKAKSSAPAKTEGGEKAAEPKADEVEGSKAPEGGKPWEKKSEPAAEEPKEESTEEKVDEGFKDKMKKAALGVGAAAALASGGAAARTADPIGNIIAGSKAPSTAKASASFDAAFGKGSTAKSGDEYDQAAAAAQATANDVKSALRSKLRK